MTAKPQIDVDAMAHLRAVIETHGSQARAAQRLGVTQQYVCDLLARRRRFSDRMLGKLGLRRVVVSK